MLRSLVGSEMCIRDRPYPDDLKMAFRSSIPTESTYAQIHTQTHKRLTFVLVSSTCHSSICVSMSPCTVSRWPSACTFRPSIRAIYITVAFASYSYISYANYLTFLSPCVHCVQQQFQLRLLLLLLQRRGHSIATLLYLFTSHLPVRWSCYSGCHHFAVFLPADLSLVIVGAQLCLYAV